jgi:general stress protein YciG
VPPRRRLQVRASTAARASAKVCACLRPGPEGWRRGRQRAPLRAAPSRAELLIAARDDRLGRVLGDASLPRIWAASESGTVSMPSRMRSSPSGCPSAWSSARVSACFVRGVTPRQPLRVCLSAPGPNFSSRRSRTASKSIPSVASTPVRTGSVRHRKPLVLCGHERSRPASQNRRSQSAHRYDLGWRGGLASGSNPSPRSSRGPPALASEAGGQGGRASGAHRRHR